MEPVNVYIYGPSAKKKKRPETTCVTKKIHPHPGCFFTTHLVTASELEGVAGARVPQKKHPSTPGHQSRRTGQHTAAAFSCSLLPPPQLVEGERHLFDGAAQLVL
eukprot:GEMP01136793.1.p2 GENE.GEMP01136793.1~~GEMP01136793.1.p2  ORF type:complete len:105 (-),score=12.60 GEMP01136793.1:61-375(-)